MRITYINNIIGFINFNTVNTYNFITDFKSGFITRAVADDSSDINSRIDSEIGAVCNCCNRYSKVRTIDNLAVVDEALDYCLNCIYRDCKSQTL